MNGRAITDAPAAARATLADLTAQRAAAVARQRELADEREALAYDAATGDGPARKALDSLTREAATAALTLENLDAAIAEARRRVAAADEEARLGELRRKAAEAQAKLADMRAVGAEAGAALDAFADKLEEFYALADTVRRLGMGGPSRELARANVVRAVQTVLARVRLNSDTIPPSERRSLADLVDAWAGAVNARIAQVLGPETDREEAA